MLARLCKVGEHMVSVFGDNLGANGHFDDQIIPTPACAVAARAICAARGLEMLGIAKVDEGVQPFDCFKNNVAAFAAIAAIWAAIFNEFFATKGHSAGAASAGADKNLGLIKEMHSPPLGETAKIGSFAHIGSGSLFKASLV